LLLSLLLFGALWSTWNMRVPLVFFGVAVLVVAGASALAFQRRRISTPVRT
jgi:hypothetical protein